MPRLTNRDYLTIRPILAALWEQDEGRSFAALPNYAQRELHDFFAPTVSMPDDDEVAHRKAMTKAFPSLPHSAGRTFQALRASLEDRPNQMVDRQRADSTHTFKVAGKTRAIRLSSVSKPKIDTYFIAQALFRISKEDVDGKLLEKAMKARAKHDRRHS